MDWRIQKIRRGKLKEPLYVSRDLLNADEFVDWAKSKGFKNILKPEDIHITIAFSREEVDKSKLEPSLKNIKISGGKRTVSKLGDDGAIVLKFESAILHNRWKYFVENGCSWDYPTYQPHISITYDGTDLNLNKIEPYYGKLHFGPEIMKKLDLD